MRKILKYIVERTYKPLLVKYLSGTRTYIYKGMRLEIMPQVFHPGFFFSTKLLLRYIWKEHLHQKTFLELGAGSGLISVFAAKNGARVTATDINPVAIRCLEKNARTNNAPLAIIHSNLFDAIPHMLFDFIIINPPYYKKDPVSYQDYAWYCGKNGEYFQGLFKGLGNYMHERSNTLMVLCDGCDMDMIRLIAKQYRFEMKCVHTRKTALETNYIFKIGRRNDA